LPRHRLIAPSADHGTAALLAFTLCLHSGTSYHGQIHLVDSHHLSHVAMLITDVCIGHVRCSHGDAVASESINAVEPSKVLSPRLTLTLIPATGVLPRLACTTSSTLITSQRSTLKKRCANQPRCCIRNVWLAAGGSFDLPVSCKLPHVPVASFAVSCSLRHVRVPARHRRIEALRCTTLPTWLGRSNPLKCSRRKTLEARAC
jgi:hypothetical protein